MMMLFPRTTKKNKMLGKKVILFVWKGLDRVDSSFQSTIILSNNKRKWERNKNIILCRRRVYLRENQPELLKKEREIGNQ
jgi:hypothetical protein